MTAKKHTALVRHRIDGLERFQAVAVGCSDVRHRIDGLEKDKRQLHPRIFVRHRIDGLETESCQHSDG